MVWIKWDDYGKKTKKRSQAKKSSQAKKKKTSKPRIEPRTRIIPGKHRVEFRKASELLKD